jgi:trehalose 6-phosphate synthase
VLVNPYDVRGVSHAIQAALSMPLSERRDRHADMMNVLRRNDIAAWARRFMESLEQAPGVEQGVGQGASKSAENRVRVVSSGH